MERVLHCDCGYRLTGSESEVIAAAQAHAWDVHGMELSFDMARSLARRPSGASTGEEPALPPGDGD